MPDPEILPAIPATPDLSDDGQAIVTADNDETLVGLWLDGRPATTRDAYARDAAAMLDFVGKPLRQITLNDLQTYRKSLTDLAPATQSRKLSSVKSLLTFGQECGYLRFNVGKGVRLPKLKNTLAERILSEENVLEMLALERHPRNKIILRLLYIGGLRISELCGLTVRDLAKNGDSGQVTVFGKGGKTRVVLLKKSMWEALAKLTQGKPSDAPVFVAGPSARGAKGHAIGRRQVDRIVKRAALRAGLSEKVSAHFLRHAAASHALDNGAHVNLVRDTLGHSSLATTSKYSHSRPNESSSKYLKG